MSEFQEIPPLIDLARKNKAKFFIQFGGQGTSFLRQMRDLYRKWPEVKDYFHTAFEAIDKVMARPDIQETRHIFFPYGFDLKNWILEKDVPPLENMMTAPISFPANQITQLAYYYLLDIKGFHMQEILANTKAATGHSQGLQAAVAIALGKYKQDFLEILSNFVQWFTVAGFLLQRSYGIIEIEDGVANRSYALDNQKPTPMVVVGGMTYDELYELVEHFNNTHNSSPLNISLHNGPNLFVMSGHGVDVFLFREEYYDYWQEKKYSWNYLDVSAPFHRDDFISFALPLMLEDEVSELFPYEGKDLTIPVISFYDGRNLQQEKSLNPTLITTMALKPLYWEKAVQTIFYDEEITHVLDFGPGKISSMLTKNLMSEKIQQEKEKLQVIAITGSTSVKKLLGI